MSTTQRGSQRGENGGGGGGGGILRKGNQPQASGRKRTLKRDAADVGASVRFRNPSDPEKDDNDEENREALRQRDARSREEGARKKKKKGKHDDDDYDSDDWMDSVASSSRLGRRWKNGVVNDEEWSRTTDQILEAKRRRRETREERAERTTQEEEEELEEDTNFDHAPRGDHDAFQGEESHQGNQFSLLTKLGDEGDLKQAGEAAVEPFNLDTEREDGTGYFEGDTYVFRRSNAADHESDAWLDSLNDSTTGTTGGEEPPRQPPRRLSKPGKRKSTLPTQDMSMEETCRELASLLASEKETVLQALQRYGNLLKRETKRHKQQQSQKPKNKPKQQRDSARRHSSDALDEGEGGPDETSATLPLDAPSDNQTDNEKKKKKKMDTATAASSSTTLALEQARTVLSNVTELAHALLTQHNETQAYEMTRDMLFQKAGIPLDKDDSSKVIAEALRVTPSETKEEPHTHQTRYFLDASHGNVAAKAKADSQVQWEYRGNQDEEIHGPFSTAQVLRWIQAGYFVGESAVEIRIVGGKGPARNVAATKTEDLMADLMEDDDDDDAQGEPKQEDSDGRWMRSDQVDFRSHL